MWLSILPAHCLFPQELPVPWAGSPPAQWITDHFPQGPLPFHTGSAEFRSDVTWCGLVSLGDTSWNSQPAVLKKRQNSGKCQQGLLLPSSRAGTGSQTPNKALHEDSAQELWREVISFPTHTEVFRNLLGLDQHWQNWLILPKQEHLLLLESLFLQQPTALQYSTLPCYFNIQDSHLKWKGRTAFITILKSGGWDRERLGKELQWYLRI